MKYIPVIAMTAGLGLAACTATTVQRDIDYASGYAQAVQAACSEALPLSQMAAALPVAGPFIAMGVQVICATDAGFAKALADPSTAAWLGQQSQMLHDALVRAGLLKAS